MTDLRGPATASQPERLDLDPALRALLPLTGSVDQEGHLEVGGVPVAQIAARYGTPAYVFDAATFRAQARAYSHGLAQRWPSSEVLFASKSFPALCGYELAASENLSIDVAGHGELMMALAAGVDPSRLYLHGNAKTEAELALALASGVGTIVIDNAHELGVLQRLATRTQGVMVRVIPEVDADTTPSNATGGATSKFGLPLDQALELMNEIRASARLHLRGVHVHIGSQIIDLSNFEDAVRKLASVGEFEAYDIGGGLGVSYRRGDDAPSVDAYLDAVTAVAHSVLPANARLLVEPGRSLVARAGMTVYSVVNVKHTGRSFVAVDGGMADMLNVALGDGEFEAIIDGRIPSAEKQHFTVVGRQCESGDTLIDDIVLPVPEPADLLIVPVTGAYAYTLANNYNGAYLPPIVVVEEGRARLAARRQTFDDILALHIPSARADPT
jgi:diaminopimelate decarboxylase